MHYFVFDPIYLKDSIILDHNILISNTMKERITYIKFGDNTNMLIGFPVRFHTGDIPHNMAEAIMYGLLFEVGRRLLAKNSLKLWNLNIKRKFQWAKIVSYGISFLGLAYIEEFCEKIHFKKGKQICDNKMMNCITAGITTFCKLEPELTYPIFKKLEVFVTEIQVNKITGLDAYRF